MCSHTTALQIGTGGPFIGYYSRFEIDYRILWKVSAQVPFTGELMKTSRFIMESIGWSASMKTQKILLAVALIHRR